MKNLSRRDALMGTLFGAGMLGVRSLATGLPMKFLIDPRKALADTPAATCTPTNPQYVIYFTSGAGDPIGCNAPGSYDDPNNPANNASLSSISHAIDPTMAKTSIAIGGQNYTAAQPWATQLGAAGANVLDRTCFCHIRTNTGVHPRWPDVMKLMGTTTGGEMLPSLIAKNLAPCLGTLQPQPVVLAGGHLTYASQPLATIPPSSMKTVLANPTGEITLPLQKLRDSTLDAVYEVYKNGASPTQRAYIDSMVTTQTQARKINQDYLTALVDLKDDSAASQITAAITLIKMNVSPVIVVYWPFGQDNHTDPGLKLEIAQTNSALQSIASLMRQLPANLADRVSFVSLNVFGRTMASKWNNGRTHHSIHQMSLMIGKPFKGSVIGGIGPMLVPDAANAPDFGSLPIDSQTGRGMPNGGDVQQPDQLAAFGKTVMAGVGVDQATIDSQINSGIVIPAALNLS